MQCPNRECGASVDEEAHACPRCGVNLGNPVPSGPGGSPPESQKGQPRRLANASLVLGILSCPLLWFGAFHIVNRAVGFSATNMSVIMGVIAIAALCMVVMGIAAVVSGSIALARSMHAPRGEHIMWRPLAGVLIGGISAIFTVWVALSVVHRGRVNADLAVCWNNLRQIEGMLNAYINAHHGVYPPLSSQIGVLMFTADSVPPGRDIGPLLTCPTVRNAEEPTAGSASPFDDQSYYYLGYALRSDDAVEAFAKAYRRQIAEGGSFDEDLVVQDDDGKHVFHRLREGVKELLDAEHDRLSLSPYMGRHAGYAEMEPLTVCDDVPIMIERDLGHVCPDCADGAPRGAHVLYLNEGVRYVAAGTWPMTEKTQRILAELAELPR